MNNNFKEHVRSASFQLTLSKRMIVILLHLNGDCPEDEQLNLLPYQALERRGLASFEMNKGFSITEAGKLVAQLLNIADFK